MFNILSGMLLYFFCGFALYAAANLFNWDLALTMGAGALFLACQAFFREGE